MRFNIELTDEAKEDVALAVTLYDEEKKGLGDLFIDILTSPLKKSEIIQQLIKSYRQIRQAAMQKFPYVILFQIAGEAITVHCIFHTSQNPKKKIKRLKK